MDSSFLLLRNISTLVIVLSLSGVVNSAPITIESETTSRKLKLEVGIVTCINKSTEYGQDCSMVHPRFEHGRFVRCPTTKVPISGSEVCCNCYILSKY